MCYVRNLVKNREINLDLKTIPHRKMKKKIEKGYSSPWGLWELPFFLRRFFPYSPHKYGGNNSCDCNNYQNPV